MKTGEECEAIKHEDKKCREGLAGNTILRIRPQESNLLSSFPRQGPEQTLPIQ